MAQNDSPLDTLAQEVFYSTPKPARPPTAAFDSAKMTKHRLPKNRISVMQPVGTNAEKSTETQGMMRAMLDFEDSMAQHKPEGYWELASVAPLTSNILSLMAEQEQDEMPELEPAGMLAGEIEGGNAYYDGAVTKGLGIVSIINIRVIVVVRGIVSESELFSTSLLLESEPSFAAPGIDREMNENSGFGDRTHTLRAKCPRFLALAFPFVLGMCREYVAAVRDRYVFGNGGGKANNEGKSGAARDHVTVKFSFWEARIFDFKIYILAGRCFLAF
ncbi:hypothetical protein B0H10DRAFT_1963940 [Mycena sp. CBHHK59/15]|nr:hypothetical protein B0H10DRAFT_1963940 [Mycena sp. CBHHK59/15]